MTVPSLTDSNTYVATGSDATYAYTFRLLAAADLLVQTKTALGVVTTLALTTDYTVAGVGQYGGGTITLVAGNLTAGVTILLFRTPSILQNTSLQAQGAYSPTSVETSLDLLTMICQALLTKVGDSIHTSAFDSTSLVLPEASVRASGFLGFDASGNVIVTAGTSTPSGPAGGSLSGTYPNPTIAAGAVTLAMMANLAANSFLGNNTGSPATPIAMTVAQSRTLLGLAAIATSGSASDLVAGTVPAARMPALTGDVTTSAGAVATTIATNAVTNAKAAQMAANTIKGNNTGGTANAADLTQTQVATMMNDWQGQQFTDFKANVVTVSGTTATLSGTHRGAVVITTNGSAVTITCPNNLEVGFSCTVIQTGAGQVTFSAAGGATVSNRASNTKTFGQYAATTLVVTSNSGGSSAVYMLMGDTA